MSDIICTCESCSGHKVKDPATGSMVQGRIVGRKEFLQHRRSETVKQCLHKSEVQVHNHASPHPGPSRNPHYNCTKHTKPHSAEAGDYASSHPNLSQDPDRAKHTRLNTTGHPEIPAQSSQGQLGVGECNFRHCHQYTSLLIAVPIFLAFL